jgi:hypothetical protein
MSEESGIQFNPDDKAQSDELFKGIDLTRLRMCRDLKNLNYRNLGLRTWAVDLPKNGDV